MLVAVQGSGWQLAQVLVVLLIKKSKSEVDAAPDILQNESQHVILHCTFELSDQSCQQLHTDLGHITFIVKTLFTLTVL